MSLTPRNAVAEGLRQRTDVSACPWALTTTSTGNEPVVEEVCEQSSGLCHLPLTFRFHLVARGPDGSSHPSQL
jgi:hypothetical protein